MRGIASFINPHTVSVVAGGGSTSRTLQAKHVLIAVGGKPKMPAIPGVELAISSDGFFDLRQQPKRVAVFGAGYIAVELAGILHALGSETHLFFRGDTVLRRGFDPYIVEALMAELQSHGPTLHPNASPASLSKDADGTVTVRVTVGAQAESFSGFDCVIFAIGREPVATAIGLDMVGVHTDASGFITVDEHENTSCPSVYALGDCTNSGYEVQHAIECPPPLRV